MTTIYVHVHIPKNSGQTFNSILRRYFGRRFHRFPETHPGHVATAAEKQAFLQANPTARCIAGHAFRYPAPAVPGLEYRYLTFLRHPIERLISLYAYERQNNPAEHPSHRPLEQWLEHRLAEDNALTNYQAYHLTGETNPALVSYERAKAMLDHYFFVGLTEYFDQSLLLLAAKMDLSLYDLYYHKKNVTQSKEKITISDATRQRLLELNQIDMQLYHDGRSRLEAALQILDPAALTVQEQELTRIRQLDPAAFPLWFKAKGRMRALWERV